MFITLEGLDGAGTTTQLARLARWLESRGHDVVTTREPSDGPVGTQIRQILSGRLRGHGGEPFNAKSLALLFAADRLDHLTTRVEPALARGAFVLSDRYVHSSIAYQTLDEDLEWVLEINSRARPADLVLFVDAPAQVCLQRVASRGAELERFEKLPLLERVRENYVAALEARPDEWQRIDGTTTIDEVAEAIRGAVQARLVG